MTSAAPTATAATPDHAATPHQAAPARPFADRLQDLSAELRAVPLRFLVLAVAAGLLVGACLAVTPWGVIRPGYDDPAAFAFAMLLQRVLLIGLVVAPPLALFRPLWAGALTLLPVLVTSFYGVPWPFPVFLGLVAVTMAATWRNRWRALVPGVAALALVAQVVLGHSGMVVMDGSLIMFPPPPFRGMWITVGAYVAAVTGAYGLALWMRSSALKARRLSTLAARAGAVEDQATVVAERARLARDLHDVVAHHVSLIAVRAETAPYTHPGLDADARHVLAEIATEARSALDELRGVLGVLRRSDDQRAADELAPQPDLAGVRGLVERSRSAGASVSLDGDVLAPVSAPVGYAVYRLVQEALTNARRHAPGQPVAVAVLGQGDRLRVRVTNPYLGVSGDAGSGGGLVGMRERVEALGGTLSAGVEGDLFLVEADLPRGAL